MTYLGPRNLHVYKHPRWVCTRTKFEPYHIYIAALLGRSPGKGTEPLTRIMKVKIIFKYSDKANPELPVPSSCRFPVCRQTSPIQSPWSDSFPWLRCSLDEWNLATMERQGTKACKYMAAWELASSMELWSIADKHIPSTLNS